MLFLVHMQQHAADLGVLHHLYRQIARTLADLQYRHQQLTATNSSSHSRHRQRQQQPTAQAVELDLGITNTTVKRCHQKKVVAAVT